ITGASLMGAIFAIASSNAQQGIGQQLLSSAAAAQGMQITFRAATALALAALVLAVLSARADRRAEPNRR
ncbi:MFS transporter, partial [Mesorhizobium sp. M00.F.Ca.ET.186.01.1.1]